MHFFDDTGDAYDDTQCRDDIKTGDTLIIESEGVVGLAWAWPVAVTEAYGKLHSAMPDGEIDRLREDAGWTVEQVTAAVAEATSRGYAIHAPFQKFIATKG